MFSELLLALTGVSTLRYGLCGLANRNLDTVVCAETDVQSGGGNPKGGKLTSASWVLETHMTLPDDQGRQRPEKASLEEVTLSPLKDIWGLPKRKAILSVSGDIMVLWVLLETLGLYLKELKIYQVKQRFRGQ